MSSPSATCVFEKSVVLDASVERVYAFHENPRNVSSISPAWLDAQIEQGSPTAKTGEEFALRVGPRGFPFKLRWRGFWREVNHPTLLVDEARESPFQFWRHEHRFESLGPEQTRMTDHVTYRIPGGMLGKLFGETVARAQFHFMFADRHRRTRYWLRDHAVKL